MYFSILGLCGILYSVFQIIFVREPKKIIVNLFIINIFIQVLNGAGFCLVLSPGSGVGHIDQISLLVFFLYCFFYLYKLKKIKKKYLYLIGVFLFSLLLGLGIEFIYPYTEKIVSKGLISQYGIWDEFVAGISQKQFAQLNLTNWMDFAHILMYVTFVYVLKEICNEKDIYIILERVVNLSSITVLWGVMEYFSILLGMAEYEESLASFITGQLIRHGIRNQESTLIGLSWEPSGYATSLFLFTALLIILLHIEHQLGKHVKTGKKITRICLLILVFFDFIVSQSFSSAWYILGILVLFFVLKNKYYNMNSKKVIQFLLASGVAIIILSAVGNYIFYQEDSYISKRFRVLYEIYLYAQSGHVLFLGGDIPSLPRIVGIIETMNDFFNRPIFGLGLGMEYVNSGTMSLLTNIGVVGLIEWILLLKYKRNKLVNYSDFMICYIIIIGFPVEFFLMEKLSVLLMVEASQLFYLKNNITIKLD